jgi:hypothetical protein
MWVIFIEMGVVLALAGLMIWWTLPKKRRDGKDEGPGDDRPS